MTNSVDKTLQNIIDQSMTNAFGGLEEEVIEELTEDEKRKQEIAKAIAEAQEARRIAAEKEKELEEVVKYKSEKATTSDEKQKEITEKSVKNKITINPEMKESIVGKIYQMYNNKYLSEKQYTLTNADKAGNTKAWQDKDKKNVKTGEPLYKKADHMKKEEVEAVDEAQSSYDKARKAAARRAADRNAARRRGEMGGRMERETYTNEAGTRMHHKGYRANANEEVEAQKKTLTIEESDKLYLLKANGDVAYEVTDLLLPDPLHELNRHAKETGKNTGSMNKRAGSSVQKGGSKDKALNFVRSKIRKETGKPEGQRKKVKGAKSNDKTGKYLDKLKSKRAYADKAKKAGFKSTQDYTNTVARYGGESNYKKGRGLGT